MDASGADPATEIGMLLARLRVPDARIRVFPSLGGGVGGRRRRRGRGAGRRPPGGQRRRRGRLVVLPVEGTPLELLWHVNTLGADRRSPMATRLWRFLDTPHAMQAMHRADGSVPVSLPAPRLRHALELTG